MDPAYQWCASPIRTPRFRHWNYQWRVIKKNVIRIWSIIWVSLLVEGHFRSFFVAVEHHNILWFSKIPVDSNNSRGAICVIERIPKDRLLRSNLNVDIQPLQWQ